MDAPLSLCEPDPPMRIKLPSCDTGGFASSSCTRSWLPFSDHSCTCISPCTRTSPIAPVLTCESPPPLVSSMRTGPFTVKVLSNVPSALGCALHPTSNPAKSKVAQAATAIHLNWCERFIVCVRRLGAGFSGARLASARPPFLPEIYEKAQPEVPARTTAPIPPSLDLQKGIERTLPITFQIQSYERKTRTLHAFRYLAQNLRLKPPRQFLRRDFNPSQLPMRPHAKLPKLQCAQNRLRAIDLLQQVRRHGRTVRHARRKTSRSGTIPRCQSGALRKKSYLRLVKPSVQQRRQHMMLVRRAMPGPEVACIVRVDSVSDRCKFARVRQRIHLVEQLVLAVIAAVGVISYVERIREFMCFDEFVAQPGGANESLSLFA